MAKKENGKTKERKFFHIVVYDGKSLHELLNFNIAKNYLLTYIGAGIIILWILIILLMLFTPLRNLLPKYEDVALKNKVIENRIMIDSLKYQIAVRDRYFAQIRKIVIGKDLSGLGPADSLNTNKFLTKEEHDSILEQISLEQDKYLEMLNLQNNESTTGIDNLHFYKPVSGILLNKFNPSEGHYGIDISAKKEEPVLAVLGGTVIMANWNPNNGYVIMVQHPNNLISVYKHNSELLKKEGDRVEAGEPIAIVGNTGENTTGPHLHFELWHNGVPINPTNYIIF